MQLEIWSDIACPWCAVGRAHLHSALAQDPLADEVEVRWRSFELDPAHPRTSVGTDYVDRLAAKYGIPRAGAQQMVDRMEAVGAQVGVPMDFSRIRPGNTFDAHRVVHLAADRGVQDAVKGRLLLGYLCEGAPIGEHGAIREIAVEAGLDAADVDAVLTSDAYADAVRRDEATAHQLGISGVPFFVVDRRLGVSGAQPPQVLLAALQQARQTSRLVTVGGDHDHPSGDACADGSCAI